MGEWAMKIRAVSAAVALVGLGLGLGFGIAACSSGGGPAQSSLGPFTISACKLVWEDGADDGQVFTSESAAQDAPAAQIATQGSEFTVTKPSSGTPRLDTSAPGRRTCRPGAVRRALAPFRRARP